MDSKKVNGLGVLDWLVLGVLLVFTSAGTFGLVEITSTSGGLTLLVRQIAAVLFCDGSILYWHNRRTVYEDETQRLLANIALWTGVVVVLLFTVIYGAESVLLGEGGLKDTMVLLGSDTVLPLSELLGFTVTAILGMQAAGTLGLILYIEQLNPSAKMIVEQRKAEGEINKRQLIDYRTAQVAISGVVGQAQAITALREQLNTLGYNEREVETLVQAALERIAGTKATGTYFANVPAANGTGMNVPVENGTGAENVLQDWYQKSTSPRVENIPLGGKSLLESFFGVKTRKN